MSRGRSSLARAAVAWAALFGAATAASTAWAGEAPLPGAPGEGVATVGPAAPALARHELPDLPSPPAGAPSEVPPLPSLPALQWTLGPPGPDAPTLALLTWVQLWGRVSELNPGSTVRGVERAVTGDVAIRRARLMVIARPHPRLLAIVHLGMNNQTFVSAPKPQLYFHDAFLEGTLVPDRAGHSLRMGLGLHYTHGLSRAAGAATSTLLTLDSPGFAWPGIEATDQFARHLGVWARARWGPVGLRVAVNRPFAPTTPLPDDGRVGFRPGADGWMLTGYVKADLLDREPDSTPYFAGTWLGTARLLSLGAGAWWQPGAMGAGAPDGSEQVHDLVAAAADVFLDHPVGPGGRTGAVTAYALYQWTDYGPDYLRLSGAMNVAQGGSTLSGPANAWPLQGTGHTVYAEAGWLLPVRPLRGPRYGGLGIQPFAATQISLFDALDAPMVVAKGGLNLYLLGRHAKLTAEVRDRPVFDATPAGNRVVSRATEGIVQAQVRW